MGKVTVEQPEAVPLTDAEAEAALRALGGPLLFWRAESLPMVSRSGTTEVASVLDGVYLVTVRRRRWFLWWLPTQWYDASKCEHPVGSWRHGSRKYRAAADAKAACEHHHVVGTWG